MGPREDEGTSGRDLIVVLDCSRSMLAENPSRLRRARTALLDLTRELQRHGGHRLGLIAFAAHPRIACPLTQDYDFFREALGSEKDVEALPFDPELAAGGYDQSGTRIGAALKEALAARDERFPSACDILLISDGDDPAQDLEWEAGVKEAASENTPIHVVGVGNPDPDESEATLIINKEAIRDPEGRPVQTRLMEGTLRAIAERTHGTYTAMQTRHAPLGQLYLNWIADKATRDNMDDRLPVPRPRCLWFLTPAFVLLCVAAVVPDRARRLGKVVESSAMSRHAIFVVFIVGLTLAAAPATDVEGLLHDGDLPSSAATAPTAAAIYRAGRSSARRNRPLSRSISPSSNIVRRWTNRKCELPPWKRRSATSDVALHLTIRGAAGRFEYLGACVLQQAVDGSVRRARSAADILEECLRQPHLDPALRAEAEQNLALALLIAAQVPPPSPEASSHAQENPAGPDPRNDPKMNRATAPFRHGDEPQWRQVGEQFGRRRHRREAETGDGVGGERQFENQSGP